MKKVLRIAAILGCLSIFCVSAQADLQPDGTMTPLPLPAQQAAWWPDSLKPVLVSHVGRHGARYLSSEKKVSEVEKLLNRARVEGTLTRKGTDAMGILQQVRTATGSDWGMLTSLGIDEETMIAAEMTSIAPQLLRKGNVSGIATYVPRVVESMYAFSTELARYSSKLEITASEGARYDSLLRFFDFNPEYREYLASGPWRKEYDRYFAKEVPTAPAEALVGNGWKKTDLQKLTMAMYGVMQGMPAAGLDISSYLWFSDREMQACARVANLEKYLQRCANPVSDLPSRAALPLLREMVKSADSALAGHADVVLLRFGHAETILPLLSLLRMPGCDDPNLSADEVATQFDSGLVSPLGANLQFYYLQGPSGAYYIAALLNGRPVAPAPKRPLIAPLSDFNAFIAGLSE